MKSSKSITNWIIQQKLIIVLSTIILWLMAAYGWKQALQIASDNDYQGQSSIPSFFSTLFVLPLPYVAFHIYRYLTKKYPSTNWKTLLESVTIYTLLIILLAEIFFSSFVLFMGALAGEF